MRNLICKILFLLLGAVILLHSKMELFAMNKPEAEFYTQARLSMVKEQIRDRGIKDPAVLKAMAKVQRQLFIPENLRKQAYDDNPLPIGFEQTISQPYIVALMSESLGVKTGEKILEVGTGSGFQAAVLAEMGARVYTVELIAPLARRAEETLKSLGYKSIEVYTADGSLGLKSQAPFDAIMVTAAAEKIPVALLEQLKIGGRMLIPVGRQGAPQELLKITKTREGYHTQNLGGVIFVPLIDKNQ